MRFSNQRVLLAACLFFAGASAASADMFEPLFTATRVVGAVQVVRPGRPAEPMRLDHAYPFETRIIVPEAVTNGVATAIPEVIVELANDFKFRLGPGTDASILDKSVGEGDERTEIKVVDIARGVVNTFITANTQKSGTGGAGDIQVDKNLAAIIIRTPLDVECTHLSQRNEVRVAPDPFDPDSLVCTFTTQNGMMEVNGPQFSVRSMGRGASVQVSGDKSRTAISSVNGEFTVAFERGQDAEERVRFKGRCIGKIWRQYADVGGRMAVAVMIYYPRGNTYEMRSYNYLEGQTNVGMWTSVAAAVSGEHSALTIAQELGGGGGGGGSDSSDGDSSDWNPDGDSDDDGGWNPDDSDDGGGDDGGFDDGGFDFGW